MNTLNVIFLLVSECKDKWKNLRAVFVRNMKPAPSGSGAKPKKAYYLLEAMQFTVPYIKALGMPSGNLPNPPEQKESFEQSDEIDLNNSELDPQQSSPFQPHLTPTPPLPSTSLYTPSTTDIPQKNNNNITPSQFESSPSYVSNKKRGLKNEAVDKAFLEYFQAKKKARTENSSVNANQDPKAESLKMFLLSMLPDLLKMSDEEVRLFKRKSLQMVDDILSNNSAFTPIHSFSSSSTTPSTDQQILLISQNENAHETSQPNTFQTINQNSSEKYYEAVNEALYEINQQ